MSYEVTSFINGKSILSQGKKLTLYDPAMGSVIGHVVVADKAMVDKAIAAAKTAFIDWSLTTTKERAKLLFRFKSLLDQHKENLAKWVTQEHGKTRNEALASVQRGIDVVDFACGIATHLKGGYAREGGAGIDSYSIRQPLGVCVGITPFNFPVMIPLWMFPLAIACGNTFVLKPSEKDPSVSIRLMELAKEAGFPDGVLNVVQGAKETVDELITHPDVQAVSFVGSSAVAEYIQQTGLRHGKRVQAFGGAKNHCIVMPDADLEQTAEAVVNSAYDCAGERCMAISVVVAVGDKVADELIAKMKPRIENIKIGPGYKEGVEMGPLVTEQHLEKVKRYIEIGKQEGAALVIDGSQYKPAGFAQGFFMGACLFDQVKPSMQIYQEEIFGPVLSIVRVPDFKTALALVNDHQYGNGTAIFTRDGYTARLFADKVQVGMVGINVPVPVPVAQHSFGGWKRSIFSDIGMYGSEAIQFYTKLKTVTQRWFQGTMT